jgi:hypothetical protein
MTAPLCASRIRKRSKIRLGRLGFISRKTPARSSFGNLQPLYSGVPGQPGYGDKRAS